MNLSLCHNSHHKLITIFLFPKKSRKTNKLSRKSTAWTKQTKTEPINRQTKPCASRICQL